MAVGRKRRKRRSWGVKEKIRIAHESFASAETITAVAKRHGNPRNRLSSLRTQLRPGQLVAPSSAQAQPDGRFAAVAVIPAGRESPTHLGELTNQPKAISKLADKLVRRYDGELIQFCYEAGPYGYEVYRQLKGLGFDCAVLAPSRIPKAPGERIKTDRRDACKLARLSRSGELTPVWVPDEEQEAMRGLARAGGQLVPILGTALPPDDLGRADVLRPLAAAGATRARILPFDRSSGTDRVASPDPARRGLVAARPPALQ